MRQRGFSLLELLVVFAIMGLLAGGASLAFDRLHEAAQYRDTIRQMTADMRVARQQALLRVRTVAFRVDPTQRVFGYEGGPRRQLPEVLSVKAVVADGVDGNGSSGLFSIVFLPGGGATGGSIEILRPSRDGVRLRVDWLTGRVTQEALLP